MTMTKIRFEYGPPHAVESTNASWPGIPRAGETVELEGRTYRVWEVMWVQGIELNVEVIVRLR